MIVQLTESPASRPPLALFRVFSLSVLIVAGAACDSPEVSPPDPGLLVGGVYTNVFFNFSWSPPEGWIVANRAELERVEERGRDFLAGGDTNAQATSIAQNSYTLLIVSRHPPGTRSDQTASIVLIAERADGQLGATVDHYLAQTAELLQQTDPPATIETEPHNLEIGNRVYRAIDCTLHLGDREVRQTYAVRKEKGYMFSIALTAVGNVTLDSVRTNLSGATFH